ncbi:MAG: thiol reductant ABC exporter subunit CydD [Chloroflexota bacterium]
MINKRLVRLTKSYRAAISMTILTGYFTGVLIVGGAWILSQAVDAVYLGDQNLSDISGELQLLLLLILGRAVMIWLGKISAGHLARGIKTDLRGRLFRHLIALGPAYVREERTGELINTVMEGVEALDAWFSEYLPQLVLAALVPVTFLVFIFPRDVLTGFVLMLTAPLIPVFMVLIGSLADALTKKQWKSLSRMSAHFLDVLQGLTTLKVLGRSKEQIDRIAKVSHDFRKTTLGVLRVAFLSALVLELIATLSTAVVAVEIGLRLLYGRMVFSDAFFVLLLAPEFYLPLRMLGTRFHAGAAGTAAAQRIFEVLDIVPANNQQKLTSSSSDPSSAISFENVSYTYSDGRVALRDLNFTIEVGQNIALIGPSGAGKSTIAHLIIGFMQPTEGTIIRSPNTGFETAWLPQRPYLFHDSIAANICLARSGASMDDVIAAAKAAQAHDFIIKMGSQSGEESSDDQGYATIIGERGQRLSGGQVQRIALARAFLMDAPFVILDEPTSHLDPELEIQLQESTDQLLKSRTSLTIAHRLSTITRADKIIMLDGGRVIGVGTHAQLLAESDFYARMVQEMDFGGRKLLAGSPQTTNRPPLISAPSPKTYNNAPTMRIYSSGQILARLFSFLGNSWHWAALSVVLGFATIASSVSLLGISAYIISAAALQPSIAVLQVSIVGVRFFGITRGVFRYLERLVSHQVTFRLLARLRVWFYEKIEPLAPARLLTYQSGDLLSRVAADIGTLENFYVRALSPPLAAIIVALLSGWYLAGYDIRLTLALWIFLALAGVLLPGIVRRLSRGVGAALVRARSALNVALVDGLQGMPDLIAFRRAVDQMKIMDRLGEDYARAGKRFTLIDGFQAALINLFSNLGMWTVFVLAVPLVSAGQFNGVYLATIALVALATFEAVLTLPEAAHYLDENIAAAGRLFEIVDAQPEVSDPEIAVPPPENYDLEIKNLTFSYPGQGLSQDTYPTVNQVSFSLPAGESLAILGPSGAGKTTLMHLFLRFWEYDQGEILLGGQDLRSYRQNDLRAIFSLVSQDTHLFNASLRENLLLARPDATDDNIAQAVSLAQIYRFIETLPQGFDTQIGEGGLKLSGGERQRLSLARALLKNAPILLLDEPTAHLDPLTARSFMETLRESKSGRSLILITHHASDLDWVDQIIYLRNGCVSTYGG